MWPSLAELKAYSKALISDLKEGWNGVNALMKQTPVETFNSLSKGLNSGHIQNALIKSVVKNVVKYATGNKVQKAAVLGTVTGEVTQLVLPEGEIAKAGEVNKISEAADVAKSSEYIDISGKNSIRNVQTNVTTGEFGSNLEESGFTKATTSDGKATTYTKGDAKYSVHESPQTSRGTAGASAIYSNGGKKVTTKIRLNGGGN